MKSLQEQLKKKDTYLKATGFLWLVFLPLLCCITYCLKTGNSIRDIYLPASQWNDEIIYYKEVEGMLHYGMPLGFFGYSENHALVGSLSVWSPVLLVPWYLWGLLFGWNMLSPFWCNIVLLMLAMGIFYLQVKPGWKQILWITIFYSVFLHFTRYALSAQVEVPVYALLIVCLGFIYSLKKSFSRKKLIGIYLICTILTLMRPYLVLLSCIPGYYLYRKNRKHAGTGIGIILLQLILYFAMTHYFCSPYLNGQSLVGFAWLKIFFEEGFKAGLKNFLYIFLSSWNTYMGYIGSSLAYGSSYAENAGIMFAVMFGIFSYKLYQAFCRKDKEALLWNGFWVAYFVIMFLAVIYLFGIASGQKHTLCFAVLGLFILAIDGLEVRKMAGLTLLMAYLFVFSTADGGYAWGIPYVDINVQGELQKGEAALKDSIELTDTISYDNTVVWVFYDVVDGQIVHSNWQMLYALPPGMGINMCLLEEMLFDLSNVQSKYIFMPANGRIEEWCQEIGARKLAEYGGSVIYQLRE